MCGCVYTYRCARVSMSEYSCRQSVTSVSAPTLLIARVGASADLRAQPRAHIAASFSHYFGARLCAQLLGSKLGDGSR